MEIVAKKLMVHSGSHRHGIFHNDILIQLIQSGFRKMIGKSHEKKHEVLFKTSLRLPYFSRKICHFTLKFLLIANCFYYALFLSSVLYVLHFSAAGVAEFIGILVPLLINSIIMGPKIVRQYALVCGTWRVEKATLCAVIEHFVDVMGLKNSMLQHIKSYMSSNHKTLKDIDDILSVPGSKTEEYVEIVGNEEHEERYIDMDRFRQLLYQEFNFKISVNKFSTLTRLHFKTKGTMIKCQDFIDMIDTELQSSTFYF